MATDGTAREGQVVTAASPEPEAPPPPVGRRLREGIGRVVRAPSASVVAATVLLVLLIGALRPNFLQASQMFDILQGSTYVGLLAGGMAYLIAMREIDLSVGSMFGLCLIAVGLLIRSGMNPWLAALAGIGLGGVLGAVNATIVAWIRIPTIVATLATLSVYRGLTFGITAGDQVVNLPVEKSFFTVLGGKVGGVPMAVIVLALVALLVGLALHQTPFGYRVLAIGSNPEAAAFSGISVTRVRTQVLILTGVLAGIAGVLGLAFFTSGDPNIGSGFELQAIAAAVIGGTPLRGGSATILGAAFGAILLNVVASGLSYFSIPANWSAFATGLVILLAVGVDSFVRSRRQARKGAGAGL
ncbi:MAG TPA: ABC transporter permease [Actinomycetota bacterium]